MHLKVRMLEGYTHRLMHSRWFVEGSSQDCDMLCHNRQSVSQQLVEIAVCQYLTFSHQSKVQNRDWPEDQVRVANVSCDTMLCNAGKLADDREAEDH